MGFKKRNIQGTQSRRTDIEALCEIIYAYGERYDDGTAAIGFTWLFKMFNRANIVGILIKAKKHGLVFFDGEIVFAVRTKCHKLVLFISNVSLFLVRKS